jgi:hypothetical protein
MTVLGLDDIDFSCIHYLQHIKIAAALVDSPDEGA